MDDVGRASRAHAPEAWEANRWIWHAAFYGLLVIATVSAVVGGGLDGRHRLALSGLALSSRSGTCSWRSRAGSATSGWCRR